MSELVGKIDWGDVPTWATVLTAIVAIWYAYRQIKIAMDGRKEAREDAEKLAQLEIERVRPVMVAYFRSTPEKWQFAEFVVSNVGVGVAKDVKFTFEREPVLSSEFKDIPFWKSSFLTDGVEVIAPGQEIDCFADYAKSRDEDKWPDGKCTVRIDYKSAIGTEYTDTYRLNLDFLKGAFKVHVRGLDALTKAVEKIADQTN